MKYFFIFLFFISTLLADEIVNIKVESMHCPLCTIAVKKAVKSINGVEKVSVKLNTKNVKVIYSKPATIEAILNSLKDINYPGIVN